MLLIQFKQADGQRRIGVLEDEGWRIRAVEGYASTYALAQAAIAGNRSLQDLAGAALGTTVLDYAEVAQAGRLLPPLDHDDSAHCYVTGTGLTHLGSADGRDAMHKKVSDVDTLTDSMKMFRMGLEGGKPQPGQIGVQPEWFYKGDGSIVCAAEQALTMPHFALDGGEEPEIAALYVIAPDGSPCRLGFALGNEFSDHVTERQNYLYLAHSKLRVCAIGPALLLGDLPPHVEGMSRIRDSNGQVRWKKPFVSGEENMSHTVANLEYHHFKYPLFRRPGDVHIHFFGTATLSCSDGIQVVPGETFEIDVAAFGPPLRNRLAIETLAAPSIRQL
ncbi:AraD1 family protein [Collimonas silvisoli]|uniref:AraD1 family protein n=1 Tax=Collimonas silvisoli TaxID=2825884 RepID=UPI001B8C00AD|nr:AraD1 family protein [Collimonas silvisoli]